LLPAKDVKVRSADTDAPNTNQHFTWSALRLGPLLGRQFPRLCAHDG